MKATKKSFYSTSRQQLHAIVPLDMPLTVSIEASSACDLRCNFCAMSSQTALEERGHVMENMGDETFAILVDQLKEFPEKFKRVYFCGLGEVLLHPKLPEMVRTIKQSGITPEVMIFTNAVNLTHDMSLGLVDAGLDIVTISVNGLKSEDYERNCGRKIDYAKYIEQIRYLYAHKGNLRINLKTVDIVADSNENQKLFYKYYGDICDNINIETISPYMQGVNYQQGKNVKDISRTSKYSELNAERHVCSLPFYKLFVSSRGRVNFCDAINGFPFSDLDIRELKLTEIWNGPVHTEFLINQLQEINDGTTEMCRGCIQRNNLAFPEEDLDPYAAELVKRILSRSKKND
ncbi:hypothetical protein FACS189476_04760 [Spirochaetia bacterium]|nr:hypothetical protein FACS189476_04760 [Spirochaetia bacterium]